MRFSKKLMESSFLMGILESTSHQRRRKQFIIAIWQGSRAVVTHVVDSMADNLRPTRAEATDVANALLDGFSFEHNTPMLKIRAI